MVTFSQYVPNVPDGETIVTTGGKLAVNKDDSSLKYGSYSTITNKLYSPIVPIGSIIAWAKSLGGHTPALPSNFVECNGQVLNDAESPYNGDTMPDLNSTQRFLRGAATSGTTGGSDTNSHTHTVTIAAGGSIGTGLANGNPTNTSSGPSDTNNLPAYYEVVFIIRIK